ncbi:MAG: helicase-related protein [Eubacteriales bacterium]
MDNRDSYNLIYQALTKTFIEGRPKPERCKFPRYRNTVDELINLLKKLTKANAGMGDKHTKDINKIRNRINTFVKQSAFAAHRDRDFYREYKRGMNIVPDLIEILAGWEHTRYEQFRKSDPKAPTVDELLSIPVCLKAIRSMSLVKIAQIIYVEESIKSNIALLIPKHPKDEYPMARQMNRRFVIHYGFTNTGKTYHALLRLKAAETGVYLSPLRLLALEIQENLNSSGVPCSLMTGEEEDIVPDANHMSSTVEKLNLQEKYDVCVIDECQMIGDSQRGFAWTRAILGVQAKEIHLCTAPEALDLLKRVIEECGDTYELVEHTRDTELVYVHKKYDIEEDVEQGDALVVFSKKSVLNIASELFNRDIQASVIYGALPYNTRKKQLERFISGETKVVVATDAIGMGLNLPIRRVVFMNDEKYDGTEIRRLRPHEVKQIAGRAGRRGIYNIGYVLAGEKCEGIEDLLLEPNTKLQKAFLGFSEILLNIDADIMDVLKIWANMPTSPLFTKTDITRTLYLINELRIRGLNFSKQELLKLTNIPFSEDNPTVFMLWLTYCDRYSKKREIPMPVPESNDLYGLEDYYKCLDLKYSFSKTMGTPFSMELIREKKLETANKINEILISEISTHGKSCRICATKLNWDYPFGICEDCFQKGFSRSTRYLNISNDTHFQSSHRLSDDHAGPHIPYGSERDLVTQSGQKPNYKNNQIKR